MAPPFKGESLIPHPSLVQKSGVNGGWPRMPGKVTVLLIEALRLPLDQATAPAAATSRSNSATDSVSA
ncbi:hypothetical protein CCS01_15355, partial [Rhodopila globiformis]